MILLTGASGFIGSHLVTELCEKFGKDKVLALSSAPVENIPYLLHNDYKFERDHFIKHGYEDIETIIHAGSFTPKNGGEVNNIDKSNSNIYTTETLINCELPNLKKIIYLSTLDVYNSESIITESTPLQPVSMYAFSKLYSERMLENWGSQNNITIQILRIGHVYGPGEELYSKVIPESFRKVLNHQNLTIWGSGEELRTFIYVEDVAKAIVKAISFNYNLGVINLVGSQSISILQLVQKIKKLANSDVSIKKIEPDFKGKSLL
jgi:nucleoside-diphosphate-sugar epimerase